MLSVLRSWLGTFYWWWIIRNNERISDLCAATGHSVCGGFGRGEQIREQHAARWSKFYGKRAFVSHVPSQKMAQLSNGLGEFGEYRYTFGNRKEGRNDCPAEIRVVLSLKLDETWLETSWKKTMLGQWFFSMCFPLLSLSLSFACSCLSPRKFSKDTTLQRSVLPKVRSHYWRRSKSSREIWCFDGAFWSHCQCPQETDRGLRRRGCLPEPLQLATFPNSIKQILYRAVFSNHPHPFLFSEAYKKLLAIPGSPAARGLGKTPSLYQRTAAGNRRFLLSCQKRGVLILRQVMGGTRLFSNSMIWRYKKSRPNCGMFKIQNGDFCRSWRIIKLHFAGGDGAGPKCCRWRFVGNPNTSSRMWIGMTLWEFFYCILRTLTYVQDCIPVDTIHRTLNSLNCRRTVAIVTCRFA